MELDYVIEVRKNDANSVREKLKTLNLQGSKGLITNGEVVLIPVKNTLSDEEIQCLGLNYSVQQSQTHLDRTNKVVKGPSDFLVEELSKRSDFPKKFLDFLPKKWEKIGHVIVLKKLDERVEPYARLLSESLLNVIKGTEVVLVDSEGIKGELRKPDLVLLSNRSDSPIPTETIHIENGIKYKLDVAKIMFSSGNGTERMHFASLKAKKEIVVDMFAGIGYFSIPMAINSGLEHLYCLEKNPDSYYYLQQNIEFNQVKHRATPILGDNRETAQDQLGKCDRISMGYLPTPKGFLKRAFQFLNYEKGGIIHYHHTCTKEEYRRLAEAHIKEELDTWDEKKRFRFETIDFRIVKSYSPKNWHCVSDIRIYPNKDNS